MAGTLSTFQEVAAILFVTAVAGLVGVRLRQPLIVVYILVGIGVGPAGLGLVQAHEPIQLLAEVGISVLLFVVGLKLDPQLVRHLGPVALATGLGQLAFTIFFGYLLSLGLGMDHTTALYVATALTFSSTIIIVKLLSDKREIDSLHGRIAMGFLIVQDIAVVIALVVIGTPGGAVDSRPWWSLLVLTVAQLGLAGVFVVLMMLTVLPPLLRRMAGSPELLVLFSVAWGVALAAAGELVGFSKEVGAFLAGFSLAPSLFREAISSRLTSIRDFLLLFFFIDLGARLNVADLGNDAGSALVLSLFVLIGNPLIVVAIMGYMGYRRRTSFLAGLTVAQISEFSVVFVAMGVSLGHVDASALGLVTLVGLTTITLSTYMILYSHVLYERLEPLLRAFERRTPFRELAVGAGAVSDAAEVVVFGLGRYGRRLARGLAERGVRVLGVDFDPEVVRRSHGEPFPVLYGDAEDSELIAHLPLRRAQRVISTMPDVSLNRTLLSALREHGYEGLVLVTAHLTENVLALKHAGADEVLLPFQDAAAFTSERIAEELRPEVVPV